MGETQTGAFQVIFLLLTQLMATVEDLPCEYSWSHTPKIIAFSLLYILVKLHWGMSSTG